MSVHDYVPVDVGLTLPLQGARLIEAGAGTGKTFTLATLVLRLVLERGASLSRVLVVTFTRAATQELRLRLLKRLRMAKRLLETWPPEAEDAIADGEAAITAEVLRAAIARDGDALVRQRIEAALLQLDDAAVATIHGFCHRALREFGFRAGLIGELEVVDDATDVWDAVATDLWRIAANADDTAFGDTDVHGLLTALWGTSDALVGDLPALCDPLRTMHPKREESPAAAALHALRDAAIERFETAMALHGACTQDQLIERLWRATQQPAFAAALAERWPLMLIDEFQDTDPRQWDIFRALYEGGNPDQRWLCLIGDPKQAIYRFRGGDLGTYLKARGFVEATVQDGPAVATLDANYRSAPGVLRAIDAVFGAHKLPFVVDAIKYRPLRPEGPARDGDLLLGDAASPTMTVHWLPAAPQDKSADAGTNLYKGFRSTEDESSLMASAAVHAVENLLSSGSLRDGDAFRSLRPDDIAVLVQTNDQVELMRAALAEAGIGAAAITNTGVFAGETAEDLHALLAALAEPADGGRLRAALATRLLGWDAARIATLDADDTTAETIAARFAAAVERWRTRGPLPALLPFVIDAAPRWMGEVGGTRRLTDALHLAELLQAESAYRHGPVEQLRWFARHRTLAAKDEARQLRLESDGGLVQIATIHKSKGLEYAVVVLPFTALKKSPRSKKVSCVNYEDSSGTLCRVWKSSAIKEFAISKSTKELIEREERAEAQRQLYVAITRAKHALHVVWSRNAGTDKTALHYLLHDGAPVTGKTALDHATMRARLDALVEASVGSIVVRPFDPDAPHESAQAANDAIADADMRVRVARCRFIDAPRLHSFSALHARGAEPFVRPGADDETAPALADDATTLGGTAFGNAVHEVLESADAPAWRLALPPDLFGEDTCPPSQRTLMERALRHQGIAATPAHIAETSRLVARALNAPLPGGVRLCDLSPAQCVRELPFHFRLRDARLDALSRLLAALGYPWAQRTLAGALDGFMHGYIDLIYRDARGRHHVLDYKTNRLPAYDAGSLRRAVVQHDYDLQYLIYLVALRRWLRLRRGAAYDERRDLGGAVYLFLRGIDLSASASHEGGAQGVHLDAVSATTIAALDAFFDGADADALIAALPTEREQ
ncbi:MAG: UvrD-helicase domain-containing protein [Lysobacter sp.]|nr:UvrD-helicase domain-containing protein [Lysobacter sp.]